MLSRPLTSANEQIRTCAVNPKGIGMFGREKRTGSQTDCYLLYMARAMFNEKFKTRTWEILHWNLKYERPREPYLWHNEGWIVNARPKTVDVREVDVHAVFIPVSPNGDGEKTSMNAKFEMILTWEAGHPWEILRGTLAAVDSGAIGSATNKFFLDDWLAGSSGQVTPTPLIALSKAFQAFSVKTTT